VPTTNTVPSNFGSTDLVLGFRFWRLLALRFLF